MVFVGFILFSPHSLHCVHWHYFITSGIFMPLYFPYPVYSVVKVFIFAVYLLLFQKGPTWNAAIPHHHSQPWPPLWSWAVWLQFFQHLSILSLIVREVCLTVFSAPPEACLFIATFSLFRLLGRSTHTVGSKNVDVSEGTHFCDGNKGFHWLWSSSCEAGDLVPSNDKHPAYQSKMRLVFMHPSLSWISSRSRGRFDMQAD